MILITEGLDRSGKTFLADKIAENFRFQRYKEYTELKKIVSFHGQLEEWSYFETGAVSYMLPIFSCFDNFIIDRFHISSYVYANFFKRTELITFEKKENLMLATKKDIRIIYCDITEKTFNKRHEIEKERKWEFEPQQQLFEKAIGMTKFPVLRIDTNNTIEDSLRQFSIECNP